MRILMLGGLLVAGLMLGTASNAQTWDNPLPLPNGLSNFNTCGMPWQTLYLDGGAFQISAPTVVYRIDQSWRGGGRMNRPWSVTLSPQDWTDMSLWVCQQRSGNVIYQCVDASDNFGNGFLEHVTVPAVGGTYYIIVTNNIENQPPVCGQYTLTAFH
ncbi:MAG: hypothetical protein ABIO49_08155 [Dokdonella sp.]